MFINTVFFVCIFILKHKISSKNEFMKKERPLMLYNLLSINQFH